MRAGLSFTAVQSCLWMVDAVVWSLSVGVSACPPAHTLFTPADDSRRMLFRSQVIYIEHSRAMTQTWVPMRTWWLLSFYAAALVL